MNEEQNPQDEMRNEFRQLGRNLLKVMQNTWESAERQKIQREIEEGLSEFANTMKEEAKKFEESQTGQQIKSEFTDIKDRLHNGDVQETVRVEILKALRAVNLEIDKATQAWKAKNSTDDKSDSSS
jgi:signal recognition particle GTPase